MLSYILSGLPTALRVAQLAYGSLSQRRIEESGRCDRSTVLEVEVNCTNNYGAVAQLGERLNGIQEVVGSIPISSTIISFKSIRKEDELCIEKLFPWQLS